MGRVQEPDDYRKEEVVMAFLLVVLTPVMLIAANLDLRLPGVPAMQQGSLPVGSRVWSDASDAALRALQREVPAATDAARNEPTGATLLADTGNAASVPAGLSLDERSALSVMALDFSLSEFAGTSTRLPAPASGPLKVRKQVYAGSRLIGNLDITIAGDGELLLDAGDVAAVVGHQAGDGATPKSKLPEQGPVSFASLRGMGVDLRYSPVDDVIVINP
jgi:hypothetical protein